ncbi:HlyD family efflux transporter periplasmic adaptor subunit [Shewanella sp. 202IG2-18]|nr:HlyD family efflux transporter periplasmic adaptor subunit [Parashewanella hymeniacidonis]
MISLSALCALLLSACSDPESQGTLTIEVKKSDFGIHIPAEGNLESTESTLITAPHSLRGRQSLVWLLPNFSNVKKGDVIARLDAKRTSFMLKKDKLDNQRSKLDGAMRASSDEIARKKLLQDKSVTATERKLADTFFSDDERVYTKIEIIDQMRNQDYLDAKMDYLDWNTGQHNQKANAEQALITLKQKGIQTKINRHETNLANLEIKAAHDGLFVYKKNWYDEYPAVGDAIFSGQTIGELPNTSNMQASLYALESESSGLKVGLKAIVYLDAYPNKPFEGEVIQVDSLAQPKDKGSPVNYFNFTVQLNETIPELMKQGRQVNAKVEVLESKRMLAVPSQSVFQHEDDYWVFVKDGGEFEKRKVTLGARNLNRTEITSGLNESEVIALTQPAGEQL